MGGGVGVVVASGAQIVELGDDVRHGERQYLTEVIVCQACGS
jgi:hypothetical protein